MMGPVREYTRRYIDEGRWRHLIWFVLVSYGIGFSQWSLSPANAHLWFPGIRISDGQYFAILFGLAFAWICVIGFGLKKCGWPGLLMLAGAKWGLSPFYLIGSIYWACLHGECL
jgi:hypothetical protein